MRRLRHVALLAAAATATAALEQPVIEFNRCHGPALGYAGAWLAHVDSFLTAKFKNSLGMEYHDYDMFHAKCAGCGHDSRFNLKTRDPAHFWLEHGSGYEQAVRRHITLASSRGPAAAAKVAVGPYNSTGQEGGGGQPEDYYMSIVARRSQELAAAECARATATATTTTAPFFHDASVALIPYWGGLPEKDGNAHSASSRDTKLAQLAAAACSARRYFSRVYVGVCSKNPQDANDARSLPKGVVEDVLVLECEFGAYLSFVMLREAQKRISDGAWTNVDVVYFTEADQTVHFGGDADADDAATAAVADAVVASLWQEGYVSPNRMNEDFCGGSLGDGSTDQCRGTRGGVQLNGRAYKYGASNVCLWGEGIVAAGTVRGAPAPAHTAAGPSFRRCRVKERAYSGAWLASAEAVLGTVFEKLDASTKQYARSPHGLVRDADLGLHANRPSRIALRPSNVSYFTVSAAAHGAGAQPPDEHCAGAGAATPAAPPTGNDTTSPANRRPRPRVAALVPYVADDPHDTVHAELARSVAWLRRLWGHVVVGTCGGEMVASVNRLRLPIDALVALKCSHGSQIGKQHRHRAPSLGRDLVLVTQARLAEKAWHFDALYLTVASDRTCLGGDVASLLEPLSKFVYVTPERTDGPDAAEDEVAPPPGGTCADGEEVRVLGPGRYEVVAA